jgi:L-lactate dehydrogenase
MILNDERAAIPIGSYQTKYGVTLSLPSIVGRDGVAEVLTPQLSDEEANALDRSAESIRKALERVR